MEKRLMKISELVMDNELYPREMLDWKTAYSYSNAMKTGAKFPPIAVGILTERKERKNLWEREVTTRTFYVVDGWHRISAYKTMKQEYIEAELFEAKDKNELYLSAVKRNSSHGRPFQFGEKARIYLKLKEMKIDFHTIETLIHSPVEYMKKATAEGIAFTSSGHEVMLKPAFRELAGTIVSDNFEIEQDEIQGIQTQLQMIENIILLLEQKKFDMKNPKIKGKLIHLSGLLKKMVK